MLAVKLETTHKPAKPATSQPNHPQTFQTIHKLLTNHLNHPQTSQIQDKLPTIQSIKSRKSFFLLLLVLRLQPFYFITLTLSSEDVSQVEIEGKWREIIQKVA